MANCFRCNPLLMAGVACLCGAIAWAQATSAPLDVPARAVTSILSASGTAGFSSPPPATDLVVVDETRDEEIRVTSGATKQVAFAIIAPSKGGDGS